MSRPTRYTTVVLVALLGALPAVGCKSAKPAPPTTTMQQMTERRSEAIRVSNEAYSAQTNGDVERAEQLYIQALDLDNSLFAAWNNLGELLLSQGDFFHAVEAFSEASFLEPEDPRPEFNIGISYQKSGYSEDAIKHFENALARDKYYRPALRGAVKAAAELGVADRDVQKWIRQALLSETNPEWREFFSTQKFRVDAAMDEERYAD